MLAFRKPKKRPILVSGAPITVTLAPRAALLLVEVVSFCRPAKLPVFVVSLTLHSTVIFPVAKQRCVRLATVPEKPPASIVPVPELPTNTSPVE